MALDAIEQLLVANHGFTVTPEGAVVSPGGRVRNVVDGKTVFTPYTPPTTGPTFAEQFAAQQAQAIADTNQVRQDEAIASGQDTYQSVATDGSGAVTNVSVGTPAAIQPLPPDDFMPGLPSAPTQTREELESAIDEARDLDLGPGNRIKNGVSDLTGISYRGDDPAYEYELPDGTIAVRKGGGVKIYDEDMNRIPLRDYMADIGFSNPLSTIQGADGSGNKLFNAITGQIRDNATEEVYDQFGGEEGALVSEYLADEAAAAKRRADSDEASDERMFGTIDTDPTSDTYLQRTGGTMQDLNEQVQREADALGISTDEYYALPPSMRIGMGLTDIGELFTENREEEVGINQYINPETGVVSKGQDLGAMGYQLGTLSNENKEEYGKAARDYLSKNYAPNYSPSLDTMDAMYYADVGPADTYSPSLDTMDAMYDADVGGTYTPPVSNTSDFEIFGDTGQDIYSIGGIDLGPGNPIGPGAGSNTGGGGPNVGGGGDTGGGAGGDTGGGGIGVGVPVIGSGVIGGGTGGAGGTGGGIGTGGIAGTMPDPNTFIVPSTVNYGTDERFKNLAPTYNVSKAAMPIFNRLDPAPSIPPVSAGQTLPEGYKIINGQVYRDPNIYQETDAGIVGTQLAPIPVGNPPTSLLAQGGIVSLAEGGAPMDQVAKDFFVRQIPRALTEKDGGGMARRLAKIHDIHDLGIDEDTFLALKYYRGPGGMKHGGVAERGYSHDGVGSLSDTARNMFRPMVS